MTFLCISWQDKRGRVRHWHWPRRDIMNCTRAIPPASRLNGNGTVTPVPSRQTMRYGILTAGYPAFTLQVNRPVTSLVPGRARENRMPPAPFRLAYLLWYEAAFQSATWPLRVLGAVLGSGDGDDSRA